MISTNSTGRPLEEPLSTEQNVDSVGDVGGDQQKLPRFLGTAYYFGSKKITWKGKLLLATIGGFLLISIPVLVASPSARHSIFGKPTKNVAFMGNSLIYFYDLPRSLQVVSDDTIRQNSILRGGASFTTLYERGNGMWNRWRTDSALLEKLDDEATNDDDDESSFVDDTVWDFGACSIETLLLGHDSEQAQVAYDNWWAYRQTYNLEDDDGWQYGNSVNTDYRFSNPCMQSQAYLNFLEGLPASDVRVSPVRWDFVVMDDNSMHVRYQATRDTSLEILESNYVPLLRKSRAKPIFMATHAYVVDSNNDDNTNTYDQIPYWTVQTYEGYRQYATALATALPRAQKPRLVNVGAAFLVVYEEQPDLWPSLFWADNKHQGPHGSMLQSCLLHHAVYGYVPRQSTMVRNDDDDDNNLWYGTRTLMYPKDTVMAFPTMAESEYLYDVCCRVADGYLPQTFRDELQAQELSLYQ